MASDKELQESPFDRIKAAAYAAVTDAVRQHTELPIKSTLTVLAPDDEKQMVGGINVEVKIYSSPPEDFPQS